LPATLGCAFNAHIEGAMKPGCNLEARKRPVNLTLNEDFAIPFVVIVQSSQFDDYRRRVAALDELLSRAWK
jgi:hypothetical protein